MDPPPPASFPSKLRLMCSYGGHIISRPHSKSLYYASGDTRIITIPSTTTTTLSALTAHLSTTLHVSYPFTFKYQLPHHDLDSLISLSSDEDLLIMLDEHHRLSPTPSRIRLFLFPIKPISPQGNNELRHPKTESWFADVLKSAKIMQKGVGFGGEGEGNSNNGEVCGAESMVLETSSSFGSTSSSVSLSNLPAKGQVEDHGVGLMDNKVKLSASESFASDNSVATGTYQDPAGNVPAVENKNSLAPLETDNKILETSAGVEMHKVVQVAGFPLFLQFDQPQGQIQSVHAPAPHYLQQNPTGIMPFPSYYVMNSPVPQQQMYYQTTQPRPFYFVPVGHPYNLPMQSGFINPANPASVASSNRPPPYPNPSVNSAQVAYKVAATSPVPEMPSQVYRTLPMASAVVSVPQNENHLQAGGLSQMNHQAQPIGITCAKTTNYCNELDDDPARIQIYKSQPPPPTLASHYKTMTKATSVLLSETLSQLHMDNIKQQL